MTLAEAAELFTSVGGRDRLELLVSFGDQLPALDAEMCRQRDAGLYLVDACQTPAFLRVDRATGQISIFADAPMESAVVRGFLGLLFALFDGCSASDLRSVPQDILTVLGLEEVLSLTRRRGFAAIHRRVLSAASCRVAAIVLAAGSSSRMPGRNKLLERMDGVPLVARTVRTVAASDVSSITVVLGHEAGRVEECIRSHTTDCRKNLMFVVNSLFENGMTSSIQTGVRRVAQDDIDGCIVCPADQPYLKTSDINLILRGFSGAGHPAPIAVPFSGGRRGNPVVFATAYIDDICRHDQPDGCRGIVDANAASIVAVDLPSAESFDDVDTEADLALLGIVQDAQKS